MDGIKRYVMDKENQLHQLVSVKYNDVVRLCAECSLRNECDANSSGILCIYPGWSSDPLRKHFERVPDNKIE